MVAQSQKKKKKELFRMKIYLVYKEDYGELTNK